MIHDSRMHGVIAPAVFDLITRIAAVHSLAAVWKIYLQAARHAGLPYGMAIFTGSTRSMADRLITSTMPTGWTEYYQRQNYGTANPLARRTQTAHSPFTWQAREWDAGASPLQRRWRDDNISAGMPGGLGVPVAGRSEGRAIVLGGENTDLHPDDRRALHFAGFAALQRMQELEAPMPAPALSERERECLKWVAMGKSDWEIGAILSLSEKTVNVYVERAKQKLRATTRIQAVALAFQDGQIDL